MTQRILALCYGEAITHRRLIIAIHAIVSKKPQLVDRQLNIALRVCIAGCLASFIQSFT
jgi:hypothetical protein